MNQKQQTVVIDNCAVDRLAEFGVNPIKDFENTEFRLMYTPDLKLEYEQALTASARTSQSARTLVKQILATGNLIGFFGFDGGPCLGFDRGIWAGQEQCDVIASVKSKDNARGLPRKRTDAHLVALAQDAIVITANTNEAHWTRSPMGSGRVPPHPDYKQIVPGVIYCLRQTGDTSGNETVNPLQPYFMVYVWDDGTVRYNFAQPKQILEIYRLLCVGKTVPYEELCNLFDKETADGSDMSRYSGLLTKAVDAIAATFRKRAVASLLSSRSGLLTEADKQVTSTSDFDLITWLVIR
jgi:hypothetical protein